MCAMQQDAKQLTHEVVHKKNETAIQTQAMCRRWYHEEIAQRGRELLARREHQGLIDKGRYKQLKDMYNQEK
eukprot:12886767-Prorocentrum_lima.AAC.1